MLNEAFPSPSSLANEATQATQASTAPSMPPIWQPLADASSTGAATSEDQLVLYGERFSSRLLLGTAKYPSLASLSAAIGAARPAMVTVALRRQTGGTVHAAEQPGGLPVYDTLRPLGIPLLPNTAGCQSVEEAVNTAHMARELFETDWIKLELIGDDYTLQPDPVALIEAAARLIRDGFKVLPYCTEDLVIGRRLLDVGCQALMPWGAPIGTGRGVANPYALRLLRERLPDTPLIVDAGLGVPSHACQVMEWGFDGVLLNTAVSQASLPPQMAAAFAAAVQAGRQARLAGPMLERETAQASTAVVGMPFWHQRSPTK